jgi:AraC-like DNA-binding protein
MATAFRPPSRPTRTGANPPGAAPCVPTASTPRRPALAGARALPGGEQDPRLAELPAPPPWAEWFRSDHLDEVRGWVARVDGEHSRVAHRAGPLGFELARLRGATVEVGWGRVGLEKTIRGAGSSVLLHLQTVPGSTYRFGHRAHRTDAGTAMLVPPGLEFTRRSPPGQTLALAVDPQRLGAEIEARTAADGSRALLRAGPLGFGALADAGIVPALNAFVQAHAPGGDRAALPHVEARLVAALAGVLRRQDAVVRVKPVTLKRLRDVEDWIEAHLEQPITVGRLCEVAGVGDRALCKVFEAHRGMSPMRYVTERRLAAAHARLATAGAWWDVADVACALGFTHLGRFAIAYREVFGESPSQTLRRRRLAHEPANNARYRVRGNSAD